MIQNLSFVSFFYTINKFEILSFKKTCYSHVYCVLILRIISLITYYQQNITDKIECRNILLLNLKYVHIGTTYTISFADSNLT